MKKILIVDDNVDFLELLSLALSKNYKVICAYSKKEALTCILENDISLLLSDFHIGDDHATALIEEIKQNSNLKENFPILIMSGSGAINVSEFAIPIACLIPKPFALKELRRVIKKALNSN